MQNFSVHIKGYLNMLFASKGKSVMFNEVMFHLMGTWALNLM